jgi:murein DD-endopeptidase MepM/ murein hydrolase activator NlpD
MKITVCLGMLMPMDRYLQWPALLVAASLLAACGTMRSSVVVEPAAGTTYRHAAVVTPPPAPARTPIPGGSYQVQHGDTLYSIAFRKGVDFRDLAQWNGIAEPYTIWPGQRLTLAPPGRRAVAPAAMPPPATPAAGVSRVVSGVQWHWPAEGNLVGRFNSADAIPGIEIAGKSGDPIRAAADGVVVYSGNGLVGYGELVIIKHSDSFLSAYGHNRKRLVKEGQQVSRGQQIAEMGSTGTTRNELEFQIRKDGNPVDPLGYLPQR